MNWNQIELKWAEMTRRVQPSLLPSIMQAKPFQNATDFSVSIDPAILPDPKGSLITGKLYE